MTGLMLAAAVLAALTVPFAIANGHWQLALSAALNAVVLLCWRHDRDELRRRAGGSHD